MVVTVLINEAVYKFTELSNTFYFEFRKSVFTNETTRFYPFCLTGSGLEIVHHFLSLQSKDVIFMQDNLMNDYEVSEGFVYDYKKDHWYGIHPGSEPVTGESYSVIMNVDLASFLEKA